MSLLHLCTALTAQFLAAFVVQSAQSEEQVQFIRTPRKIEYSACREGKTLDSSGNCVTPVILSKFFLFKAPPLPGSDVPPVIPKPRIDYDLVFVHTQDLTEVPPPIVAPPDQTKTVVYVLTKNQPQEQKVIHIPEPPKEEPEVYFVHYKDGQNLDLPGGLSLKEALGQETSKQEYAGSSPTVNLPESRPVGGFVRGTQQPQHYNIKRESQPESRAQPLPQGLISITSNKNTLSEKLPQPLPFKDTKIVNYKLNVKSPESADQAQFKQPYQVQIDTPTPLTASKKNQQQSGFKVAGLSRDSYLRGILEKALVKLKKQKEAGLPEGHPLNALPKQAQKNSLEGVIQRALKKVGEGKLKPKPISQKEKTQKKNIKIRKLPNTGSLQNIIRNALAKPAALKTTPNIIYPQGVPPGQIPRPRITSNGGSLQGIINNVLKQYNIGKNDTLSTDNLTEVVVLQANPDGSLTPSSL